jgi:PAS domain S-box-containing protein
MWVYEAKTYRFLDVNEAATVRYGYTKQEFLEITPAEICPDDDVHLFRNALEVVDSSSKGGEIQDGPYRHKIKNGTIIYVDLRFNFIDFRGAKAVIILATDVTGRVGRLRAIEKQNQNLKEIAWTQSHVVRAPLSRLKSIVKMLNSKVKLDEAERKLLLTGIQDSADELDIVTKDIIRKSRVALADFEPANNVVSKAKG